MPVRRTGVGHRRCQDCGGVYQRGVDTDPRWCPSCVSVHEGRCKFCRCGFLLDGVNTLCPSCRDQEPLFELFTTRVGLRLDRDQAAAVLGDTTGGER